VLERHLHTTAPPEDGRTPMLDHVVHLANDARVEAIADGVGVTTRTLHRHCVDGFGYGAKTLHAVLRFRRYLALADAAPGAPLAQLAFMAGYADQPHLTRECRRLSGLAPRALRRARARTDR
jgi:transcriptional regulator GlxA family with amidase domain